MENFGIYFYRTLHSRHGGKLSKLFNTPLWCEDTAVHCTLEKLPSRIQHLQWQRDSQGDSNIFCLPLNIFSVPAPDRDPWTVLGSRAGGHFIHAAAHDSAVSAPPRTSQPPHNRGRAGHSNKFIFSTAAAVIISACNSPPSIIRYLMVTSRGDVGYNCNGYQSLVIFTHENLLLCFIGACADL